jgi:hypothetical protein
MACFCSAHFKDIPDTYANGELIRGLGVPRLIETYYPEDLFPELYDDAPARGGYEPGTRVFREANPAAASLVSAWLDLNMPWDDLVEAHTSKYFSAGDCMMVLFRFSTFLQSCARLQHYDPNLSALAKDALKRLLRDPLDARNRMLVDDEPETVEVSEHLPAEVETETQAQTEGETDRQIGIGTRIAPRIDPLNEARVEGRVEVDVKPNTRVAQPSAARKRGPATPSRDAVEVVVVEPVQSTGSVADAAEIAPPGTRRKLSLFRRRETGDVRKE